MGRIIDKISTYIGLFLIIFGAATIDSEDRTIPFLILGFGVAWQLPYLFFYFFSEKRQKNE